MIQNNMIDDKLKKNKGHRSSQQSSNIDTPILEKLSSIVSNTSNYHSDLIAFIENGFLIKVLSNWSYFASVNNHSQFIDLSVKLSKITNSINVLSGIYNNSEVEDPSTLTEQLAILELKPHIIEFYKDLLHNNLKVIYRALNNNKASLTNPNLRILTNLINYDSSLANEFLNSFDLNLNILPKLLVPTKLELESKSKDPSKNHLSIRFNFIKFWIALNSKVTNYIRKDLLINNYKIMNNLWKYMYESDSISTITLIVEFIDNKVLNEINFKRSTKCKVLNENFMFKIQLIFNRLGSDTEIFNRRFIDFMNKISTNSKFGLVYTNDKLWQDSNLNGVSVSINNKTFKVNNKLIYTLLTALKPWESHSQLQLTINILKENPELIPPYMNWSVQHGGGYHDPSLSSWWIGHTLLLSHIIQLPIPEIILNQTNNEILSQFIIFDNKLISENISLAPLSKSSLTKCIESKHYLIRQLSLQLIMFILQKLNKFLSLNIIDNKQELIELVFNNLPDLSNLIQLFNNIYKEYPSKDDMKLIKLTLVSVLNQYEILYPKNTSSTLSLAKISNNGVNEIIKNDLSNCSGFEVALLDIYLSIQSQQEQEQDLKWWNKSNNSNSFFTCLIKLSISDKIDGSLVWKIYNLLTRLTDNKLIFNKKLVVSPILSLVHSFKGATEISETIWNLLDEVISRSIRSPYRFLDLSHKKYNDVSLFVIVFFEQFRFVLKNDDNETLNHIIKWFFNLLKYLIVIGESKKSIIGLLNDYLFSEAKFKEIVSQNNLLDFLEFNQTLSNEEKEESFLEFIINTSNLDLIKRYGSLAKKIPISKLDFAGLLLRFKLFINDHNITTGDNVIIELMSKLGNFLLTLVPDDLQIVEFMLSKNFWEELIISKDYLANKALSSKNFLVGGLINEIFQQLPKEIFGEKFLKYNEFNSLIFELFQIDQILPLENQRFISKFNWILLNDQIMDLIDRSNFENQYLTIKLMEIAIERSISIKAEIFDKVVNYCTVESIEAEKRSVLSKLIENKLVNLTNQELFCQIDKILCNTSNHYLLKSFINIKDSKRNEIIHYLVNKSSSFIKDDYLLCFIGYSISLSSETSKDDNIIKFFDKLTKISLNFLKDGDFETKLTWDQLLTVLSNGFNYGSFSEEVKLEVSDLIFRYVNIKGIKQSFIPEFANLVYQLIRSSINLSEDITSWIHKAMLYITKKFAESLELSDKFNSFLHEVKNTIRFLPSISSSIWKLVPASIINTQLEVLLNHKRWILKSIYLQFANCVIMEGSKNIIKFERLLQIFINNDSNILKELPSSSNSRSRFESALLIYNLFNIDPSRNSNSILLEKLILLYLGSIRSEDLLIKSVLIKLEANLSKSWVSQVSNWEFSEELTNKDIELVGEERLILKDKSSFVISLNKNFIKNSLTKDNRGDQRLELPRNLIDFYSKTIKFEECWEQIQLFYDTNATFIEQSYQKTIYDPEFLLMLIIHNEELVKFEKKENEESEKNKPSFDIKKLIDSNLLQFIVYNLSNNSESIKQIAKILIFGILKSIDYLENFKDKNIYKVYLSNILFTLKTSEKEIPSLVWFSYSNLIPILSNPGHFLYEKTFRYILSNPLIRHNDIPLYSTIIMSKTSDPESENDESYYKQVIWLIQNLVDGTKSIEDLLSLKLKGVIEWILNLMNSPFLTMKIKSLILEFLFIIQNIDQGSDVLITRFAILTDLEQSLQKINREPIDKKNQLINEQLKLNLDKLSIRFGISVGSNKRLREWTNDDLPNYVKRFHNA